MQETSVFVIVWYTESTITKSTKISDNVASSHSTTGLALSTPPEALMTYPIAAMLSESTEYAPSRNRLN